VQKPDAVVVGAGPNGLAAALTLARAGLAVEVLEGAGTAGGGCRTEELTLPGFLHDVCSAVHPMAAASPFFRATDLAGRGVRLLSPPVAFAHPLDGGRAAGVTTSVVDTAGRLGADGPAYMRLLSPLVRDAEAIIPGVLAPLLRVPQYPLAMARFGIYALLPADRLVGRFETPEGRALFGGVAAHAMLPLSSALTAGFGLVMLILAHAVGWPVVEGGSARLVDALVAELLDAGGGVRTGEWITDLGDVGGARATMLDISPKGLLKIGGARISGRSRRALDGFRYGPGICKLDWALSGPVPWDAELCRRTATVHVGGTFEEVARSEADCTAGRHCERPFCIVVQPCVVDPARAPAGRHTLWGYCHVPSGSDVDMTERIEAQIERFAPGFRDLVLARTMRTATEVEQENPNYVGGAIDAGAGTLRQTLFRPTPQWNPYRTPIGGVYLCSASTPPGGGVHGMCGHGAARTALRDLKVTPATEFVASR
jgi:phytoene dehydrogenase-like protein